MKQIFLIVVLTQCTLSTLCAQASGLDLARVELWEPQGNLDKWIKIKDDLTGNNMSEYDIRTSTWQKGNSGSITTKPVADVRGSTARIGACFKKTESIDACSHAPGIALPMGLFAQDELLDQNNMPNGMKLPVKQLVSTGVILSLCGMYSTLLSQQKSAARKGVIENGYLYYFSEKEKFHTLYKSDINSLKTDSFIISYKSKTVFNDSLAKWQVKDTSLFYIFIYNGNDEMVYPQLRHYSLNKLKAGKIDQNYLLSPETLFNNSVPITLLYTNIFHHMDASDGPIFFDYSMANDSILLYIYNDDVKQMYIFNLRNYLANGYGNEMTKYNNARPWKFLSQVSIDINSPFKVIRSKEKAYIVIDDGNIYLIDGKKIEKTGMLPKEPENGMIITDKDNDEVFYIDTGKLFRKSDLTIKERITKFGIKIFETK